MRTVVQNINGDSFIYFVNESTKPDFHPLQLSTIGYIQFYINYQEQEVSVLYMYVANEFRGNNLAMQLLREMSNYCCGMMENQNINRFVITLDDMSDRFALPNNIYSKFGFRYCSEDEDGPCGPEMMIEICSCSKK